MKFLTDRDLPSSLRGLCNRKGLDHLPKARSNSLHLMTLIHKRQHKDKLEPRPGWGQRTASPANVDRTGGRDSDNAGKSQGHKGQKDVQW
jgi:hypothetical protein